MCSSDLQDACVLVGQGHGRFLPAHALAQRRGVVCVVLAAGALAAIGAHQLRSDLISLWAAALRERVGWQKAAVALANKNARILWAVMTRGEAFNLRHVSVKPSPSTPTPVTA